MSSERVAAIVGPTASGKTAVAIELAKIIPAEIISADSMAVYRGMDIGTAKPTAEERRQAVFHAIDIVDPIEGFSAGQFEQLARETIIDISARGKLPLLAGGTGLYVRAALDGLDTRAAAPNQEIRNRLSAIAAEAGGEGLLKKLSEVDSETAAKLNPKDIKRIIRALEIFEVTGRPASEIYRKTRRGSNFPNAVIFGLTMNRQELYARIESRIDAQMRSGLLKEVETLLTKVSPECVAMQGLGYKELARHLMGEISLDEAVYLFKRNTRRFAKRQLTWFRADSRIKWIDTGNSSAAEVAVEIYNSWDKVS